MAARSGALPSTTIAHIPALSAFIRILSSGSRFTLRSDGFIWSRRSGKKMGWRPSLPAPSSPKSFLPLSVSSPAVQYRRRSGEAPTSSFSMHKLAFCWVMDHWVGSRRQAGDPACSSEIHPEYQDQAALAAPAALDQVPSLGRMLKAQKDPPP